MKYYLLVFCLVIFFTAKAQQNVYDLKNPGKDEVKLCGRCFDAFNEMPVEVELGAVINSENEIVFVLTDQKYFSSFFKNKLDGIAIDLVSKNQYVCNEPNRLKKHWAHSGTLLEPFYLKDLKKNTIIAENGIMIIKLGKVPDKLKNKELEANILFIIDGYVCHYYRLHNIPGQAWDLLDMGMFMDSIVYSDKSTPLVSSSETAKKYFQSKRLKFIIPFEKGKSEYSKEDIKPIYDSLNLTDFTIRTITIKAFSSVEGSEEKNMELQQKRASSISQALQSYQTPSIETDIYVSENWIEFLNDIHNSPHTYLSILSKNEIKEQLKNKKTAEELEPILKNHRKAILIIELEKKSSLTNVEPEKLVELFEEAIKEKNISRALEIQNTVMHRIRNYELAPTLSVKLEIPKKLEFGELLNNRAAFNYLYNPDAYAALLEFQELEDLLPEDGKIKYNICVLKFQLWLQGDHIVKPEEIKKDISRLSSYGVAPGLIDRMNVNYSIIMCETYMQQGDYLNKDKSLKYIQNNYKYVQMTDDDLVSLAQYFVTYSKYDWATQLLEPHITKVDAGENLIFYYVNLTIANYKSSKHNQIYHSVLMNAVQKNEERFCTLFNSITKGGISFQLLEDDHLKKVYCENCR
ncbi:MAG: hypothetical protein ACK4ND_12180 [Cytophagaceae bacterium]